MERQGRHMTGEDLRSLFSFLAGERRRKAKSGSIAGVQLWVGSLPLHDYKEGVQVRGLELLCLRTERRRTEVSNVLLASQKVRATQLNFLWRTIANYIFIKSEMLRRFDPRSQLPHTWTRGWDSGSPPGSLRHSSAECAPPKGL
eukprot:scaffold5944_cov248-Pinguiococcus_pyrenoidosus.AAC.3